MEGAPDPKVGEIRIVDFDPQAGRGQAGRRPALVISNDCCNAAPNNLFIVCPLTPRDRGLPYHVALGPINDVLPRPSFVMCEQICAQDRVRFVDRRGDAPLETRRVVRDIIRGFLDDLP